LSFSDIHIIIGIKIPGKGNTKKPGAERLTVVKKPLSSANVPAR